MNIRVVFNGTFYGAVHSRDFRTPACMVHGDGGKVVTLDINIMATHGAPDYCGLLVNNVSICFKYFSLSLEQIVLFCIIYQMFCPQLVSSYECLVG